MLVIEHSQEKNFESYESTELLKEYQILIINMHSWITLQFNQ
jgi:hypothetical protein